VLHPETTALISSEAWRNIAVKPLVVWKKKRLALLERSPFNLRGHEQDEDNSGWNEAGVQPLKKSLGLRGFF